MADVFNFNSAIEAIAAAEKAAWHGTSPAHVDLGSVGCVIDGFAYADTEPVVSPIQVEGSKFSNDTDAPSSQRFADSKTTSASTTWTVRQGVTSVFGQSVQVPLPHGVTVTANESRTVAFERTDAQTVSTTQTWSWDMTIPIPARSRVDLSLIVEDVSYSMSFTAVAKFSGSLKIGTIIWDPTGLHAYDPFHYYEQQFGVGELFAAHPHPRVQVADASTILVALSGVFETHGGRNYRIDSRQIPLKPGAADVQVVSATLVSGSRHALGNMRVLAADNGPQIGSPDGIGYTVSSTRQELRPSPACGFNDLGVANGAMFNVETRFYEEWRDGTLVRSWVEEISTFDHCVDV
ncbi:ETX/MTX2 family pore-forming toxin [Burkholderia sp. lyk4-R2A-23]|uniref:ETX/MTX2 family pore-forming toxin n=1 Tax=Burkholderia sp. lyk4-R2A-23 TaxID=3040284 RepID=UPI002550EA14|nr:ETX/MTX2 family pore-forming toxin [Burkholderia sp. lyk4-R2A-23]